MKKIVEIDTYSQEALTSKPDATLPFTHPAKAPTVRKAYICKGCDGVYADSPVTQCDCMPVVQEFFEGTITYSSSICTDTSITKDANTVINNILTGNYKVVEQFPEKVVINTDFAKDAFIAVTTLTAANIRHVCVKSSIGTWHIVIYPHEQQIPHSQ